MNKTLHAFYLGFFFLTGITITIGLAINGLKYYETPLDERFFDISHEMLKPSGLIGHGLGIIGSALMVLGVVIYMVRKRVRRFVRVGSLKYWLEFHIFLCTLGPVMILFHTAFKFGGLVAVSFWSMTAVVISGIIGKFIYVQIPRTIQGRELDVTELNEMNEQLTFKLRSEFCVRESILLKLEELYSPEKYKKAGLGQSLYIMIKEYFAAKKILRELGREIDLHERAQVSKILKVIRQKLTLSRRIGMYRSIQKLFKYWHVAHLPFAMVMFFIMIVHIVVAVAFGYKWIF